MRLPIDVIEGGFNTRVKVEYSTAVTYPAVWLFVRNSQDGPVKSAVHLNVSQARQMRDALDYFIEGAERDEQDKQV
jgi:hypothetical protein